MEINPINNISIIIIILFAVTLFQHVALSTTKAKYVAAHEASCEAVWLQKLLIGLFNIAMKATCILCDNQSCIKL
jgi:formate-dependent nitrite reductase membrane component NrfD